MLNMRNAHEKIDYLYKLLIAPVTFFILISWSLYSTVFVNEKFITALESTGFHVEAKDINISVFSTIFNLAFVTISILFYVYGYFFESILNKIFSLYFLLVSFSFNSFTILFGVISILPLEFGLFLPSLIVFIPFLLVLLPFLNIKKYWKFYIIVYAIDIIGTLLIPVFNIKGVFPVILITFLNLIFSYVEYRKEKSVFTNNR